MRHAVSSRTAPGSAKPEAIESPKLVSLRLRSGGAGSVWGKSLEDNWRKDERVALGCLFLHGVLGFIGGLVFGSLLLAFDIGQLRSLLLASTQWGVAIALYFFCLGATFGWVGMSAGVMRVAMGDE